MMINVAEGSDPMNWDTDGDWLVDWFEVNDDEEDGVRGDSSPIRYDSRNTGLNNIHVNCSIPFTISCVALNSLHACA